MLKSTQNKGFSLTFENGLTISVQFGYGNYCQNRNHPDGYNFAKQEKVVSSNDAEIAIWDKDNKWFTFPNEDTVEGWVETNKVAEWITKVSKASSLNDLK